MLTSSWVGASINYKVPRKQAAVLRQHSGTAGAAQPVLEARRVAVPQPLGTRSEPLSACSPSSAVRLMAMSTHPVLQ